MYHLTFGKLGSVLCNRLWKTKQFAQNGNFWKAIQKFNDSFKEFSIGTYLIKSFFEGSFSSLRHQNLESNLMLGMPFARDY